MDLNVGNGNASPVACDLTAIDAEHRQQHAQTARELFAAVQEVHELSDGFALRLPNDTSTLLQAVQFIAHERQCCPFFRFVLDVKPAQGPIWLRLTGREDVKQFLQSNLIDQLEVSLTQESDR